MEENLQEQISELTDRISKLEKKVDLILETIKLADYSWDTGKWEI